MCRPLRRRLRCHEQRRDRAFTLVEILVVIAIILITSLIALPVLSSFTNGGNATSAAQIVSGALAGARDAAIHQNEPRGIRLVPDPTMTIPSLGSANAGMTQLAYNRMIPIEPAPDYSSGKVNVGPQLPPGVAMAAFPPVHPISQPAVYPYFNSSLNNVPPPQVLMVEESPISEGFMSVQKLPNEPCNFWWNVRVGDKIKFGSAGRAYTIVGPCTINPWVTGANNGNPEMFCNVGPPGTVSPLKRTYYDHNTGSTLANMPRPEFLFVVNGVDDDGNGVIDDGWNGYNENANAQTDELAEWTETEQWLGSAASITTNDISPNPTGASPSFGWASASFGTSFMDVAYTIQRRPVPSPGAREILLPTGIVIDATAWNLTGERSQLPIERGSLNVDIMLNPNGLYIPTTIYSSPMSMSPKPFLHFWLAAREDVFPIGLVTGQTYYLPMPTDAAANDTAKPGFQVAGPGFYPPGGNQTWPVLKNDRRLVTLFCQSGMVVTNTLETVPKTATSRTLMPGEGFNVNDYNQPFYKAQLGQREVK